MLEEQQELSDEDLFRIFDVEWNGSLSAQEIHEALEAIGEDVPVFEIEEGMVDAGISYGRIDLETFKQLKTMLYISL